MMHRKTITLIILSVLLVLSWNHPPVPRNKPAGQCNDCTVEDIPTDEYGRPILENENTLDTPHFLIHYTLQGEHAVPSEEYVQAVAETMEHIWDVEIDQFGWNPPPPDDGIGGDDRYDVYLLEIVSRDNFGYADKGEVEGGDNPNTEIIETNAYPSYLVLDNDYAGADEEETLPPTDPLDYMRTTAAHEFMHSIQFGYDTNEPADWSWEASATWVEDEVYDDINDSDNYLSAVFKSPDTCQIAYGGEERREDEQHWYGEWIFLRFLSERYGRDIVRRIWEHAIEKDGYQAITAALREQDTTLEEVFRSFSISLLTRDFEEGDRYPTVRLQNQITDTGTLVPTDGVGQMGGDYFEVQISQPVRIRIDNPDLNLIGVGIDGDQAAIFTPVDTINPGQYEAFYLLVLNEQQPQDEADCYLEGYQLSITQAAQGDAPAYTTSAAHFTPPTVESVSLVTTAPDEWLPRNIPEGYEYVDSYIQYADDFGEDAMWYAPAGGEVTVIDYYGPGDTDYFRIYVNASDYTTLDNWLSEIDYQPNAEDIHIIQDTPVLIEDHSDETGEFTYAYLILDSHFFALEGTFSPDVMQWVVESLLSP